MILITINFVIAIGWLKNQSNKYNKIDKKNEKDNAAKDKDI